MDGKTSNERLNRMVTKILDTIEEGDDPQPHITRLSTAQPWLMAQMGMEQAEDSIQRTREADDEQLSQ